MNSETEEAVSELAALERKISASAERFAAPSIAVDVPIEFGPKSKCNICGWKYRKPIPLSDMRTLFWRYLPKKKAPLPTSIRVCLCSECRRRRYHADDGGAIKESPCLLCGKTSETCGWGIGEPWLCYWCGVRFKTAKHFARTLSERNNERPPAPVCVEPVRVEKQEAVSRFSGMALQISDKLAAALALTPHRPDAKPIGEEFSVAITPKLGPMALIHMVGDKWSAHDESGGELDLDDARIPVLRNIAFGACDLLAKPHEAGKRRVVEKPDGELPVKLIRPTHHITVEVGADFRPLVIEIIEGKRSYETATTEAIFVRGHWTHQPCGPARSERKLIWRQPHYRGRGSKGGRTYEIQETP